jgi:hypothetical protein
VRAYKSRPYTIMEQGFGFWARDDGHVHSSSTSPQIIPRPTNHPPSPYGVGARFISPHRSHHPPSPKSSPVPLWCRGAIYKPAPFPQSHVPSNHPPSTYGVGARFISPHRSHNPTSPQIIHIPPNHPPPAYGVGARFISPCVPHTFPPREKKYPPCKFFKIQPCLWKGEREASTVYPLSGTE